MIVDKNKILIEWAYRTRDGKPNPKSMAHQIILEGVLKDFGWGIEEINELIRNLQEKRKPGEVWKTEKGWAGLKKGEEEPRYGMKDKESADRYVAGEEEPEEKPKEDPKDDEEKPEEKAEEKGVDRSNFDKKLKDDKDAPNGPTPQQMLDSLNAGSLDAINEFQDEVERNRAKGIAGAGGAVASEGESKYCVASSSNLDEWSDENKDRVDKKREELKGQKRNAEDTRTATAIGLDPDSPEFLEYLAKREAWAEQKLEEIKKDKNSVFYLKGKKGFADAQVGGKVDPEGAYLAWMRVAYDGARTTQIALRDSDIDTEKPVRVVQSTREIDNAVQAHLEDKLAKAEPGSDDEKYYKHQLKLFKKFRTYHDTFAIGVDENGRTCVVSISNKKDGRIRDPQNNTTPAQRLRIMKEQMGEEVAKTVANVIDEGIARVSNAQADTVKKQTSMKITDEVVKACTEDNMDKYIGQLDDKAGDTRTDKYGKKMGAWLEGPPKREWPSGNSEADMKKKLELMQEFAQSKLFDENGNSRLDEREDGTYYLDDNGNYVKIKHLGQIGLPYEPFGKISVKLGQFKVNDEVMDIKKAESSTVEDTHTEVVSSLFEADADSDGYDPDERPDADNGPNTQGYIEGVLGSIHVDSYIDLDDEDDDRMLIQMGVNGVKPSMVRECTAEQSGYDGDINTPEGRKGLKEHLKKRCRVTPGGEKVSIVNEGKEVELFTDQWRTAGTAQKVASYFGKGMRECLQEKARRK